MKTYLCAFAMCQSMFCAIPFPGRLWDEKARGKMLLFLPVVGLEIGLAWAALAWAVRFLKLPALVGGLALCACPFLLTGYKSLDGMNGDIAGYALTIGELCAVAVYALL